MSEVVVVVLQEVTFSFSAQGFASLDVKKQFFNSSFKKINVTSVNLRKDGSFDGIFQPEIDL